jgi:hypothetical protein
VSGTSVDYEVTDMPNLFRILRDAVTLVVESIDRIYLHGYAPALQRPNQLAWFFYGHRKQPMPSPALLQQMTKQFVDGVHAFAKRHRIPIVQFKSGERKDDVAQRRLARFRRREGVVFIGVAQENARSFRCSPVRRKDGSIRRFNFYPARVCVNHYYFYVLDRHWGPGFIKFCSYAPFDLKVCLNGHEWAKRQLARLGIPFEALDNGFRSCPDPERLQAVCDSLGPHDVAAFFGRWLGRLPSPFTRSDRAAGYRYQLSIWQFEYSHTQVFDRPLAGRQFFEEVIRENLDLGRPDRIQLLFGRRVPRTCPSSFRTRVVQNGVLAKLSVQYKNSRVKQYFKEGRALRTETVINNPKDLGVNKSLKNLPYLRDIARNINRRLLELERTSHNCVLSNQTFESLVLPSKTQDEERVPGLRFGEPRVMAVFSAVSQMAATANGFSNRTLRERVTSLLPSDPEAYSSARMTYDLRRLRLHGLIERVPRTHRYLLTSRGRRVVLFCSKTFARIFRPALVRLDPAAPADAADTLRAAWKRLDAAIEEVIQEAKIAA